MLTTTRIHKRQCTESSGISTQSRKRSRNELMELIDSAEIKLAEILNTEETEKLLFNQEDKEKELDPDYVPIDDDEEDKEKELDPDYVPVDDDEDEDHDDEDYEKEMEIMKEQNPEAYESLTKVREEIIRIEPRIIDILKEPLRLEDKTKLVQYYEIYKDQTPNTEEWLDARDGVIKMFKEFKASYKQHSQYTEGQHKQMEKDVEKFTGHNPDLTLKYKILNLETSQENKEAIYRRFEDFSALETADDEYGKLKHWLNWATDLPYDKVKKFNYVGVSLTNFMRNVSKRLDEELYGMKKVKEQILIFLNAKLTNPSMTKCNLGLIGPPGVGKTKISRLLAEVLDYPFEQISFGGVDKADFIKGHEYTYVGAQPGEIVKCLKRMGYKNGILFLDEYEKISDCPALASALLHITDSEQNGEYVDNFLNPLKLDLSHIWYIFSMNKLPADAAISDRIFTIQLNGYSHTDKVKIVEDYLLPKALKNINLAPGSIKFKKGCAIYLIRKICDSNDRGVRTIEKAIASITNKLHFILSHQNENGKMEGLDMSFDPKKKLTYPVNINTELINKLLESKALDIALEMMYL
jgi:ATP-dependent Lon protease